MAYSRNVWQCGDAISTEKLNNIEDGIEEALACCGGGGGYDFIIRRIDPNDPVVFSGDFDEVYNKVVNREPVFGYFVNYDDYYDAVVADVVPLCYITNVVADHSLSLSFSKTGHNSANSIYLKQWDMIWSSSGITSYNRSDATVNGNP